MIRFRKFNRLLSFAFLVLLYVFLTACQAKEAIDPEFRENSSCIDVQYSAKMGMPLDVIQISAIPSDFEDLISLVVTNMEGNESLLVPVERQIEGVGGSFHVPVHPSFLSSGGDVKMTLLDKSGHQCEAAVFTIDTLPKAPGAYQEAADLLGELGHEQARLLGLDMMQMSHSDAQERDPYSAMFNWLFNMVQGEENDNSIKRIASNESAVLGEISEEDWRLLDGLVERSGMLPALKQYIRELKSMEAIAFVEIDQASVQAKRGLVTISSFVEVPTSCRTRWHSPDAATLDKLMNMQITNEIYGHDTTLLDASGVFFGVAGVLATAAGSSDGLKAAGAAGLLITGMKLQYESLEGILPSEFIEMSVDADPVKFLEDAIKLDGRWDQAVVIAQSRGWSGDKIAFEFLLNQLSGRVTDGVVKHFNLNIFEGTTETWKLVNEGLNTAFTNELYGQEVDRTGLLEIPPCEFGPTDISDKEWSRARIANEDAAPVSMVDHHTYRAHATGEAILEISPRDDRFGRRAFNPNGTFFSIHKNIEILPIEVVVNPSDQRVEPGESAVFTATVKNAHDLEVLWEVDVFGGHRFFIDVEPDGTSVFTVHTSSDPNDFPLNITAVSVSETGLRALPDAPPREGYGLLRSDQVEVEVLPDTCCVAPGESQPFTAVIHGFANQEVTWSASGGSITETGLFTAPEGYARELITVTATSVEEPAISGESQVLVRDCYCYHDISIKGQSLLGESSFISWQDDQGGTLESMTFIFAGSTEDSSDSVTIEFMGNGPKPGETGTFPVEVEGWMSDIGLQHFVAREHQMVIFGDAVPWEMVINNEVVILDVPPYASLTIDHFEQGPEPHMARIEGTLLGEVLVLAHRAEDVYGANPERLAIDLSFTGYYDKPLSNGTINCYGDGW